MLYNRVGSLLLEVGGDAWRWSLTIGTALAQPMTKPQVTSLIAAVKDGADEFHNYPKRRGRNATAGSLNTQAQTGRTRRSTPTKSQKATAKTRFNMKKIVLFCAGLLALSLSATAQDLPKFDVFGGYSYFHFSQSQTSGANVTGDFNGADGSVAYYPSEWLGIVGDFGGNKISRVNQGGINSNIDGRVISYLFGPRIRFGSERVNPFVQVLFGGAHHGVLNDTRPDECAPLAAPCKNTDPQNTLAMTAEGGIDFKVARHFAVRGQAGYLDRFPQGNGNGTTENNARVLIGIVIY